MEMAYIYVTKLDRQKVLLQLPPESTIGMVKAKLEAEHGQSTGRYMLLYRGKMLNDSFELSELQGDNFPNLVMSVLQNKEDQKESDIKPKDQQTSKLESSKQNIDTSSDDEPPKIILDKEKVVKALQQCKIPSELVSCQEDMKAQILDQLTSEQKERYEEIMDWHKRRGKDVMLIKCPFCAKIGEKQGRIFFCKRLECAKISRTMPKKEIKPTDRMLIKELASAKEDHAHEIKLDEDSDVSSDIESIVSSSEDLGCMEKEEKHQPLLISSETNFTRIKVDPLRQGTMTRPDPCPLYFGETAIFDFSGIESWIDSFTKIDPVVLSTPFVNLFQSIKSRLPASLSLSRGEK
ncbi:unnamed protein product [Moneuplotes crassus]|uniref:Ubiquitin-like domain-containing protein n=1 Tax=Euplotes crassus TaxID=5936 RepID=A0AAD1UTS6_EUPCR|nr:unnamed protein product [Moneuplotes crassus]